MRIYRRITDTIRGRLGPDRFRYQLRNQAITFAIDSGDQSLSGGILSGTVLRSHGIRSHEVRSYMISCNKSADSDVRAEMPPLQPRRYKGALSPLLGGQRSVL